jgi:hypothetical protein
MKRLVLVVLYANIAILLLGAVLFMTRKAAIAATEPATSRQVAALFLGIAVTYWIVSRRFPQDARWLLVPIVIASIDFVVTHVVSFGSAVLGLGIPYDPAYPLPLVADLIAIPVYVIGYVALRRSTPQSLTNAAGAFATSR